MNTNDIRLNADKRKRLKESHRNIILKQTPTKADEDLKVAVEDFKERLDHTWKNIIEPTVCQNYPQDEMRILKKYSRSGYGGHFATWDTCFTFKPTFNDEVEKQFKYLYSKNDMTAIYHDDLMNLNVNPSLSYEFENRDTNPKFYQENNDLDKAIKGLNVAKYKSEYDINDSDVSNLGGHVLLVPNTGSCHSRVMMMSSESDWQQLLEFEKSRTFMHNCQREAFLEKLSIINDMNALIDSAKFVSEVEKYWDDLLDCVDLHNQEIGQELSIVSNETKERLSNFSKIRQANREILAVVSTGVANDTNS